MIKYIYYEAYRGVIHWETLFKHTDWFKFETKEECREVGYAQYVAHDDYLAILGYSEELDIIFEKNRWPERDMYLVVYRDDSHKWLTVEDFEKLIKGE